MEITQIIEKFKVAGNPTEIKQLTCGNINQTYRITMSDGVRYILQNININIFTDPVGLMNNIFGVCAHIKAKLPEEERDRRAMTFIDTKDGEHFYRDDDGKCWRMYVYIDAISYQSIEKPGLFYKAAKAFGEFQQQLADYPADTLAETIKNFHNTVSRFADFKAAIANCKLPERLEESKDVIDAFLARESLAHVAVDKLATGELPLRVTHNDTKLNNILMDEATDEGLCVIDLDTVMPGSVLYDFGDAIRFGAATTAEDDPDTSKMALDLDLFAEFVRGFIDGTNGSLTQTELDLLPEGAMLLTYECAIRFIGDYLNGDTYFKINYEKHNLVRARAQLALLVDMEKKLDDMRKIVKG
ncbi:MAG: aminoglycoside phosphotransferase family protein [Clostridiales bacterium]|nr:aminoglycoside phosphotransferase family protein [Clostridiales bacterium]